VRGERSKAKGWKVRNQRKETEGIRRLENEKVGKNLG